MGAPAGIKYSDVKTSGFCKSGDAQRFRSSFMWAKRAPPMLVGVVGSALIHTALGRFWCRSILAGVVPALQGREVDRSLHGPRHHAQHDLGRLVVAVTVVAVPLRLAELVGVLALEQPRGRRPVLVAGQGRTADRGQEDPLELGLLYLVRCLIRTAACSSARRSSGRRWRGRCPGRI